MKLNFTIFSLLAEVANLTKLFPLIEKAVGTFGMSGLDRLLGLQATSILQKIVGVMDTNVFKDRAWFDLLDNMSNSLNPIENVITQVLFFIKKNVKCLLACLFYEWPFYFSAFQILPPTTSDES